jgi:nucleotide-binding universal stress UspA family protein
MARYILVLPERPEEAANLLKAAEGLAELAEDGEVTVLAIHRPVSIPIGAMTDWKFNEGEIAPFVAEEQRRLTSLAAAYDKWAGRIAGKNIASRWLVSDADAAAAIKAGAEPAGFIVAARPLTSDDPQTRETFRTALFETGRPVLVVPPRPFVPKAVRVAIAWRDEAHATQALLAALPLLKDAEQLHVLAGVRENQVPPPLPDILHEYLGRVSRHDLPIGKQPFGETLLAASHALCADLLVMGAYFHSPLRERLFGGVTRYMLTHADLPLLMFH